MKVNVVIPYRPNSEWRRQAFEYVSRTWLEQFPEWTQLIWDSDSALPFSRAKSRNSGVREALERGSDVVVVLDADIVIPDPTVVHLAVIAAYSAGGLHIPYTRYRSLTQAGTLALMAGQPWPTCPTELDWDDSYGAEGGLWAIRPQQWFEAGGIDERFTGWGCEDTAFVRACSTLYGLRTRYSGVINHLWHPGERVTTGPGWDHNVAVLMEYYNAYEKPQLMRELIDRVSVHQ